MMDFEKAELEGLITQWEHLNDYEEKINMGHWQVFTVVFAAFGIFSINGSGISDGLSMIYWVIPLTVMVALYYEAYKLREAATLSGYLAKIELEINRRIAEIKGRATSPAETHMAETDSSNIFNWYYTYQMVFASKHNGVNTWLPLPIVIAYLYLHIIGVIKAISIWNKDYEPKWVLITYIILITIVFFIDAFAFASIIRSRKVKFMAFSDRNLTKKAEKYWKELIVPLFY